MTKIATNKPETLCRPVYVTPSVYEVWYSKPKSLGKLTNRGGYWYTEDGFKFISSRDAMSYLLRISKLEVPVNLQSKLNAQPIVEPPPAQKILPRVVPGANSRKQPRPSPTLTTEINQNHPMFQQFLEFQEYMAKKKAEKLVDNTSN